MIEKQFIKVNFFATVYVQIENGTDINIIFDIDSGDKKESYLEDTSKGLNTVEETFNCTEQRNFTIFVNATNIWNFEFASANFVCLNPITRFWSIETNSPQIAPPGKIIWKLSFIGEQEAFPESSSVQISFDNNSPEYFASFPSFDTQIEDVYEYTEHGMYNITVNVSNSVDFEIFSTQVTLYEKLGILEVTAEYILNDPEDFKDLHGLTKTDIPVGATVYFTYEITGTVHFYSMSMTSFPYKQDAENAILLQTFDEIGQTKVNFFAWNPLEISNEINLDIRILAETKQLEFSASSTAILPGDDVTFAISFLTSDPFTCFVFISGDESVVQTYGNVETCLEVYTESDMQFNGEIPTGKLRKRETKESSWIDSNTISILHTYTFGGIFNPKAEAFNTIFKSEASIEIQVSHPPAFIWIENNSTNIFYPLKKFSDENFRLETTAFLVDNNSMFYDLVWEVNEISRDGAFIKSIDISSLKSNKCSALRFSSRFLAIGMYKVTYSINIIVKESLIMDNITIVETMSCYTFLEIISSGLEPVIIKGGASYILRGFGQKVYLEPGLYSKDLNDLDDKNFIVEWSCRRFDRNKIEEQAVEHLADSVINRNNLDIAEESGGCFQTKQKDSVLNGKSVALKTTDLWDSYDFYMISMVIKKDMRSARNWLFLDVIQDTPPGIIIMCEKEVACFVTDGGFIVNSNKWLSVRAECVTECGENILEYTWDLYGIHRTTYDLIDIDNWKNYVVVDQDRLGINHTLFSLNPDITAYHIKVTGADAKNKNRPAGVAKLYISLNVPPKPGSCELVKKSGLALIDMFMLHFVGWTDEDGLKDFSVYMEHNRFIYHIHYGQKKTVEFLLPEGEIKLMCSVADRLGASTTITAGVISVEEPSPEAVKNWTESTNLLFYMAEGKMGKLAQAITIESLLYAKQAKDNYVPVSSEINKMWMAICDQPGIDSSYFTIQAREEIEAQIQDDRGDTKSGDASENEKLFEIVQKLPFEVLSDTEVYGMAVSTLAESRPLNKKCKEVLSELLNNMFESSVESEVAHPSDRSAANMLVGNGMNCLTNVLTKEVVGGQFLQAELNEAYEELKTNFSQPNFFSTYVRGSRREVEQKVRQRQVDYAKNATQANVLEQADEINNITDQMIGNLMKDVLVGENPMVIESSSGFHVTVVKKKASELSENTLTDGKSSVVLPSACSLLGKANCNPDTESIGVQSVRFSGVSKLAGATDVDLSADSNSLDITLTNREGNDTLKTENSEEPFLICLPISPPDYDADKNAYNGPTYVQPVFGNDNFLVYHRLKIATDDATVVVKVVPDVVTAPLVFFFGIGYKPSLLVYDGRFMMQDTISSSGIFALLIHVSQFEVILPDKFYFAVGHLIDSFILSAFNVSSNLTWDDMTSAFITNYTISLSTTGCYFFDSKISSWSSRGCQVKEANSSMVCCECNHLTTFGTGFIVAPNLIDFDYVFANVGFDDNLVIYITLIISFSVYIILLIWARWKDIKDFKKLGATPLPDNDARDKYLYEAWIYTGHQFNAGTKSKVHFIVSGEDDDTDVRTASDDERPVFKRTSVDIFVMAVPHCLGQLSYLRIWHDNSGKGRHASWYLKHVIFKDVQTGHKYAFIVERWLAVEEADGQIDVLVPVAGREQANEFSHVLSSSSASTMADNHLWFSVFMRPARSRFTRVQRLSCCLAVLYLSMLTSAMWYQTTQPSGNAAFKFGPFALSPEQIAVGLMSNLIVFPPTFLIIFIFRKSRARVLRSSHVTEALNKQNKKWKMVYGQNFAENRNKHHGTDEESQLPKRKRRFSLPWWFIIVGWLLVIACIGSSLFFLWAYALQFGNEKTSMWLTSLVVSFFSSVLLTEPIKILFLAVIAACICSNPGLDDDDMVEDEEDPHLNSDEQWLHNLPNESQIRRPKYLPIDPERLEFARQTREKELKMYSVIREMLVYFLYLWILMVLSYGNRDPNSFTLRQTLINNFIKPGDQWNDFHYVNTEIKFWNWTRNAFLPELFVGKWYNERAPMGLRLYTDDRNNFKIGYAVLRQVRVKPNSCNVHKHMQHIISDCAPFASMIYEDGAFYGELWNPNINISSIIPTEYKYMTASDLNGYPFWGQLDWYGGGGYIVPLISKRYEDSSHLVRKMRNLEISGWTDKGTRAVFVEFGTYNAQVNLFVVVTIVAEFVPGGGIVPYYHIDPIKLLHYHTGSGLLQLGCQIGFLVFTGYYTVIEFASFFRQGLKYVKSVWNVVELSNLLAAYAGITVEIYKMFITWRILEIFTETEGTGYIKLQEALILDEAFCYLIGFLMSLATLKFLKLLRFNRRIGSMSASLKLCMKELRGYSICLLITFVAFVILFWMTLGRSVKEFCSFFSSFESSISMLLKKFNYEDMEAASRILAPFAFFTFALTASVVLINILLTIIIQSFEEVKRDETLQGKDYELMSFIINRLKLLTGLGKPKLHPMPLNKPSEAKKKYDAVTTFPGKIDKLVDFVNSVYFEEEMDFENKDFLKQFILRENDGQKNSRPPKISDYQSQQMKNYLDF